MFRFIFLLAATACTQVRHFDVFDDEFSDRWSYKCNDHEDDSQVVVILDHCDEDQLFVRSEIQMDDNEKYWGALLNVRECHWEAVVVLDRIEYDHTCTDIDFVEVERLNLWDEDDTGTEEY